MHYYIFMNHSGAHAHTQTNSHTLGLNVLLTLRPLRLYREINAAAPCRAFISNFFFLLFVSLPVSFCCRCHRFVKRTILRVWLIRFNAVPSSNSFLFHKFMIFSSASSRLFWSRFSCSCARLCVVFPSSCSLCAASVLGSFHVST